MNTYEVTYGAWAGNAQVQIKEASSTICDRHASVQNLFNPGRHLVRAEYYGDLRVSALNEWMLETRI